MITKPTKYTEAFVLEEVRSMLTEIRSDTSIFYLWQVFDKMDYSMQRFSEWRDDFKDNEEISEAIKKIKEILETRIVIWAMKKELHVTMTIFHLKNNYKWTDKGEESQNSDNNITSIYISSNLHEKEDKVTHL